MSGYYKNNNWELIGKELRILKSNINRLNMHLIYALNMCDTVVVCVADEELFTYFRDNAYLYNTKVLRYDRTS